MNRKLKIITNLLLTAAFTAIFASCSKGPRAIKTPDGYSIETVLIPKGTFLMGSSAVGIGVPGTESNERQHRVTLTKDYYMSKYPITNAQYAGFLNHAGVDDTGIKADIQDGQILIEASSGDYDWGLHYNGNRWEPAAGYENHPVIRVSWYGAKAYAEWAGGDLPTEAQWERAARGGVENRSFGIGDGKELTREMANFQENAGHTTAAGAYPDYANAYGLYDMHGNVLEWCLDRWDDSSNHANLPSFTDPDDPVGIIGYRCVLRGGNWVFDARRCRSAFRSYGHPDIRSYYVGFRVVFRGDDRNDNARNCRSAYRNNNYPDIRNNNVGFRVVFYP
ncbi:MAG: formylglycine-generating enzyme family protein [Tannerella sp.]|jgi:formylglycine-generating enzyme required for sulfatase activity|nr:formylglycine-generating enzyme family protein [Tannerella sp.]